MPESDDRLASLQRRIDEAKSHSGQEKTGPAPDPANMSQALRFTVELASGLAVGVAAGYFIDRRLGTFPWFMILCFFLGTAAGFRNMLRDARRNDDEG